MKTLALALGFALTASAQITIHEAGPDHGPLPLCVTRRGGASDITTCPTQLIPPVRYEAPQTSGHGEGYMIYEHPTRPPICALLLCAQYADGSWYVPKPEQAAYCTEIGRVRRLGYHDWRCGADHRWRRVK